MATLVGMIDGVFYETNGNTKSQSNFYFALASDPESISQKLTLRYLGLIIL